MLETLQQEPFLVCVFGGALEAMAIEGRLPGLTLQQNLASCV